jgi:hypothetical protein
LFATLQQGNPMKAIIAGKTYDTETATVLGTVRRGTRADDSWLFARLYCHVKAGERFFIYGEGAVILAYAAAAPRQAVRSGQAIIPVDRAEAARFAKTSLPPAVLDAWFPEVTPAPPPPAPCTPLIPPDDPREYLAGLAHERGTSRINADLRLALPGRVLEVDTDGDVWMGGALNGWASDDVVSEVASKLGWKPPCP